LAGKNQALDNQRGKNFGDRLAFDAIWQKGATEEIIGDDVRI
jgi:hypothetical protein